MRTSPKEDGPSYLRAFKDLRSPLVAARKLGYCWLDQTLEVRVLHAHSVSVGAGPKDYGLVLGEALLHIDGYVVEVAEGWHRPYLAVREGVLELLLFGQACLSNP